ncbi:MAG: hypothetical protein V1690_01720 [Candidatus Moraniibacteriota bacterium]
MSNDDPFDFHEGDDENFVIKRYFSEIPPKWVRGSADYTLSYRAQCSPSFSLLMLEGDTVRKMIDDNGFVEYGGYHLYGEEKINQDELVECYLVAIRGRMPYLRDLVFFFTQNKIYPLTSKYLLEFAIEYPDEIFTKRHSPVLAFGEYFLRRSFLRGNTQIWLNCIEYGGYYRNPGKCLVGLDPVSEKYGYFPEGTDKLEYRFLVTDKPLPTPVGEKLYFSWT